MKNLILLILILLSSCEKDNSFYLLNQLNSKDRHTIDDIISNYFNDTINYIAKYSWESTTIDGVFSKYPKLDIFIGADSSVFKWSYINKVLYHKYKEYENTWDYTKRWIYVGIEADYHPVMIIDSTHVFKFYDYSHQEYIKFLIIKDSSDFISLKKSNLIFNLYYKLKK